MSEENIQLIEVIILLITSIWAILKFRIENPLKPRIEFDVDVDLLGEQNEKIISQINIYLNNKGNVEHKFKEINVTVRGIEKESDLTSRIDNSINFPTVILPKTNIVPNKLQYYFVRPSVNQRINYAIAIPKLFNFVLVRVEFIYKGEIDNHSTEKIIKIS